MEEDRIRMLCREAIEQRKKAYVPYSHFTVGAALLTEEGTVYRGCNIENASFPAGNCAERTAIFKAVSEGERKFAALAVSGGLQDEEPSDYCLPCGICLQVMSEFFAPETKIFVAKTEDDYQTYTLRDLLPHMFGGIH